MSTTTAPAPTVHRIPLGSHVVVSLLGVPQHWGEVVVIRHDRNVTYRLHCVDSDTYVTAHEADVTALA